MTIDEAIMKAREKAKEKRKEMQCKTCKLFAKSDLHPLQGYCRKNEFRSIEIDSWSKVCSEYVPKEMCKCAEEHEQLAEWLEELKELRATSCGYSKEDIELNRNAMYNKAIDDFADKLKQDVMTITFGLRICDIDRIAEQLKAGVKE